MVAPSLRLTRHGRLTPTGQHGHVLAHVTSKPDDGSWGRDGVVRVLVVDDSLVFRDALREWWPPAPRFAVVGQACSGAEAVALAEQLSPQLVLMDVMMPGMDGIAAAHAILARQPRVVVVLMSVDDPASYPGADDLGNSVVCARKQAFAPRSSATCGKRPCAIE